MYASSLNWSYNLGSVYFQSPSQPVMNGTRNLFITGLKFLNCGQLISLLVPSLIASYSNFNFFCFFSLLAPFRIACEPAFLLSQILFLLLFNHELGLTSLHGLNVRNLGSHIGLDSLFFNFTICGNFHLLSFEFGINVSAFPCQISLFSLSSALQKDLFTSKCI